MDGDKAPLKELVELKIKYDTLFYVDEAHATGIFGPHGSGVVEETQLADQVDMIMGTFGKALGSYGAYVATTNIIKKYLINKVRGFIFSTALPPGVVGATLAGIELVKKEPQRRKILLAQSEKLRNQLQANQFQVKGNTHIIPIMIGPTKKAVEISQQLIEAGYYILAIRPPTVPEGSARLRLSITYNHTEEQLNRLAEFLRNYENYKNR